MISEKLSTDSRRMLQNGVPQFVGFCRCTPCRQRRGKAEDTAAPAGFPGCTPCRQRRGKVFNPTQGVLSTMMHPVQAAPRQSLAVLISVARAAGCTPCRQRRGKDQHMQGNMRNPTMHPVQAAPRQSQSHPPTPATPPDAPRAGSAEAKMQPLSATVGSGDAPRAGSAEAKAPSTAVSTPSKDAPRAGSAEAKCATTWTKRAGTRCTPCRQRTAK